MNQDSHFCPVNCTNYRNESVIDCSCGQPGDNPHRTKGESLAEHKAHGWITVDAEEWEELNHAFNHARNYIASDRQEGREWKGWTLDEFDAACERVDSIRAACRKCQEDQSEKGENEGGVGNMILMRNADREKFALLYEPGHSQHGWIFYDNYGRWVTLRRANEEEMRKAKWISEMLRVGKSEAGTGNSKNAGNP